MISVSKMFLTFFIILLDKIFARQIIFQFLRKSSRLDKLSAVFVQDEDALFFIFGDILAQILEIFLADTDCDIAQRFFLRQIKNLTIEHDLIRTIGKIRIAVAFRNTFPHHAIFACQGFPINIRTPHHIQVIDIGASVHTAKIRADAVFRIDRDGLEI